VIRDVNAFQAKQLSTPLPQAVDGDVSSPARAEVNQARSDHQTGGLPEFQASSRSANFAPRNLTQAKAQRPGARPITAASAVFPQK
jgi:hypothetical protein